MELHQKYRILEEINPKIKRKFGRNFIGEDKESQQKVIIKVVSGEFNSVPRQQLRNESSFSFTLEGLPIILDYYETDDEAILIKEFKEGQPINSVFKALNSKQKTELLKEVFPQIVAILNNIHEIGIIHCDLKPGNILIDDSNSISIIDFGLAINQNNLPQRKLLFPLGFAAPELLLNHLDIVDSRTDQFAFGITIWNLFTNEIPHRHANPSIMTNLQLNLPLPEHQAIKKDLYRILNKMCNKHAFKLPPNKMNGDEVKHLLKEAMDERYSLISEIGKEIELLKIRRFF